MRLGREGTNPQLLHSYGADGIYPWSGSLPLLGEASEALCHTLASPFPFPGVYSLPSVALMKVLVSLRHAMPFKVSTFPSSLPMVEVMKFHMSQVHATLPDLLGSVCRSSVDIC